MRPPHTMRRLGRKGQGPQTWGRIALCIGLALLVVLGSGALIHRVGFATPRL